MKKRVLFLCTGNSARSQMAEGRAAFTPFQILKDSLITVRYHRRKDFLITCDTHKKFVTGFTLIELIIILVIIGILAVVAIVKMLDMPGLRLNMSARRIQSDIRYAQSLASGTQKWTGVFFNATNDNYTVYINGTGASPGAWSILTDPLTRKDFTVQLNNAEFAGIDITLVQFNQPDRALIFDKWGNPYDYDTGSGTATALASSGRITVTSSSGTADVRVERGTGRVYIE